MTNLNPADLATYTAQQVASLADLDRWAVKDEGFRRQNAAERKIARLTKQIESARREMAESALIIQAALVHEAV